ncbi:hypothetical protein ABTM20_19280, partial [Acinetobacter baumannii]
GIWFELRNRLFTIQTWLFASLVIAVSENLTVGAVLLFSDFSPPDLHAINANNSTALIIRKYFFIVNRFIL